MSIEIIRIEHPSAAELQTAFEVCEERWPELRPLNRLERFVTFEKLRVELVIARQDGIILGACYVMPASIIDADGRLDFVWLFDFACRVTARTAGSRMLLNMMTWYPVMCAVGITDSALPLYTALRWGRVDGFWRYVHPFRREEVLARLPKGRIPSAVARLALTFLELAFRIAELTGAGVRNPERVFEVKSRTVAAVAAYLEVLRFRCGAASCDVVLRGHHARIVFESGSGLRSLRVHARMWQTLRRRKIHFLEFATALDSNRRFALLHGYFAMPMPILSWGSAELTARIIAAFRLSGFGFADTDKIF